jgi:hypothetical protein|tara:strand:+ start:304 stop:828 length:525 start_codon:yes stop_codon:yes gene_type:complete
MSINIHGVENNEEIDKCIVCLELLDSETQYKLPECNHSFHQNCIMHWFRGGNNKCPLCNNLGVNDYNIPAAHVIMNTLDKYKFKILRQYSRRKDAPDFLKKEVQKLKKTETEHKKVALEIKEHKNKTGVFKEMKAEFVKLRRKKWRLHRRIFNMKIGISNMNIVPLIIAKKQNV